jgi:hypothetical protein
VTTFPTFPETEFKYPESGNEPEKTQLATLNVPAPDAELPISRVFPLKILFVTLIPADDEVVYRTA